MDILISEDVDGPAFQKLGEKYRVARDITLWKDAARLNEAVRDIRAIVVRNQTQVIAEMLNAAPKLVAIGRVGVGLDNIDVPTASKLGVVVIAPLDANAVSVAELSMGFVIALARKIPQGDRATKAGGWDRRGFTGIELDGKTIAICGFGRIGRLVAVRARAFGMRIAVFDPFVKADSPLLKETNATLHSRLEDAVAGADFITTHSPLTPETKHMFNAQSCAAMKRGAFFINTSRGGVVDETALLAALRSGHLGGAALDVREIEPPKTRAGFEDLDNVILTPHVGAFTAEAQRRAMEAVAADLDRVLQGQPAVNFVNFAKPGR